MNDGRNNCGVTVIGDSKAPPDSFSFPSQQSAPSEGERAGGGGHRKEPLSRRLSPTGSSVSVEPTCRGAQTLEENVGPELNAETFSLSLFSRRRVVMSVYMALTSN